MTKLSDAEIAEGLVVCKEAGLPWELWTGCSWRRFGRVGTTQTVIEPITYSATDQHPDLHLKPGAAKFVEVASVILPAALTELQSLRQQLTAVRGDAVKLASWHGLLARAQAAKVIHCNYTDRRWLIYKHGNRADHIDCEIGPDEILPIERADIRAAIEEALDQTGESP